MYEAGCAVGVPALLQEPHLSTLCAINILPCSCSALVGALSVVVPKYLLAEHYAVYRSVSQYARPKVEVELELKLRIRRCIWAAFASIATELQTLVTSSPGTHDTERLLKSSEFWESG